MSIDHSFTLEIAAFTPAGAMIAAAAGAHRIELCDNPAEGGTTPSAGVLKTIRQQVSIPVFPIIRPRGGDFVYGEWEIEAMKHDISLCKNLGFEGVVIGLLHEDGTVNKAATAILVELAYPLEVTFHRAFDRTPDPFEALESIIDCGCQRILTSGQVPDVNKATSLIAQLVQQADHRITIMPGSGVKSSSIGALAKATGATEFHASARMLQPSTAYNRPSMDEEFSETIADKAEIHRMLDVLRGYFR